MLLQVVLACLAVVSALPSGLDQNHAAHEESQAGNSNSLEDGEEVGKLYVKEVQKHGGVPPSYEPHFPHPSVPVLVPTITSTVSKTHTLRLPVFEDVWVTSVKKITVPVTQLVTRRQYVPASHADTATSFLRLTRTAVDVTTSTSAVFPTKTMVSAFTIFLTDTKTVDLWQPIVHLDTKYEVLTSPVLETQTLIQHLYTTVTRTKYVDVTSTRVLNDYYFH